MLLKPLFQRFKLFCSQSWIIYLSKFIEKLPSFYGRYFWPPLHFWRRRFSVQTFFSCSHSTLALPSPRSPKKSILYLVHLSLCQLFTTYHCTIVAIRLVRFPCLSGLLSIFQIFPFGHMDQIVSKVTVPYLQLLLRKKHKEYNYQNWVHLPGFIITQQSHLKVGSAVFPDMIF